MWVVDYIGGGDRHMSADELDGSAKEPSAVSSVYNLRFEPNLPIRTSSLHFDLPE